MYKIQLLIFIATSIFTALMFTDFFIFSIRRAPKSSNFTRRQWTIAFLFSIADVYFILNGMKFF